MTYSRLQACGHDGHVAMLVGAASVLAAARATLRGAVVLLFQPAEERHSVNNPLGGAIRMLRDHVAGVLDLGFVLTIFRAFLRLTHDVYPALPS